MLQQGIFNINRWIYCEIGAELTYYNIHRSLARNKFMYNVVKQC